MAHKKGMGSTRNGRDSEAKRLGVKKFALRNSAAKWLLAEIFLFAREALKFTLATMLASAVMTLCMLLLTVRSNLNLTDVTESKSAFTQCRYYFKYFIKDRQCYLPVFLYVNFCN